MKMNLTNLKKKSSVNRDKDLLKIKGKYFTYSPLGLVSENGQISIPIKDITYTGKLKYKDDKARTKIVIIGVLLIIFDRIFRNWVFDLLDIPMLDIIYYAFVVGWIASILTYLHKNKSLLEITTTNTRYCIYKGDISLQELRSLVD